MKTYTGYVNKLNDNQVFVFGSNLTGFHGGGAAGFATFGVTGNRWREFDYGNKPNGWKGKWTVKGIGEGMQEGTEGKSYALPTVTKAGMKQSLSHHDIKSYIANFYACANEHPDLEFLVAYCRDGKPLLNGWTITDMAILFASLPIPENVVFEEKFGKMVDAMTPPEENNNE